MSEERIMGRTEACDFIGKLSNIWRNLAKEYEKRNRHIEADIFNECAEMLESKIEEFAST